MAVSLSYFESYLMRVTPCIAVTSSRWLTRCVARQMARIPMNAPTGSQMAARIRKRLDAHMKEELMAAASEADEEASKYEFDSMAAERFYQLNKNQFTEITSRRQLAEEKRFRSQTDVANVEVRLPLKGQEITGKWNGENKCEEADVTGTSKVTSSININDRGFCVEGDRFTDEYTAATVFDFPEDEINSHLANWIRYGPDDAVEEIEFQQPGQSAVSKERRERFGNEEDDAEWMQQYGSADPTIAVSEKACSGCGAKYHCKDPSLPGFLPVELFSKLESKKGTEENLCRRCYLLEKYNFLLNVNVCEVDYRSMMSHLKLKQEALILLVVDMSDLPGSIYARLPDIIGDHKPMIIVGNKVDLLPPDQRSGYLKHFRETLFKAVEEVGFTKRFNLLHTALISAKTGFGIEELITNIHMKWSTRGSAVKNDIYLVGCTNAGKSTLFNTLLQSDLCKVRAVDLVQRATTSIWPGTTISLLKFPVMNPTPHKLELRRRRLLANQAWVLRERRMRTQLFKETGDAKYVTLQAYVGNTFKETEEELQPISIRDIRNEDADVDNMNSSETPTKRLWNPEDDVFAKGNWCYDTPGTVNEQQVLNLFTLDELIAVLPRKMMQPRTFIVYPGDTLLIGATARVDLLAVAAARRTAVFMSVFASELLPLNVMKTSEVDSFMDRYSGSAALVVPQGDANRLAQFPKLEGREMELDGRGMEEGAADVILSSIGWVCVTAERVKIRLRAFTPAARGLAMRQSPILPFCAKLRGSRIAGTAAYRVRKVELPVNEKRLRREKASRQNWKDRKNRINEEIEAEEN
ncbi:Nitric oxide-associated protein 1 [Toxocara canis]|uniref:Nitric oxide-associated protein 1 n=1 Tax=Toxocara canis TaxID=6265 RepID=A0A0B2V4G2_TOXCA|nr:Nitric oxide-associated protein 1 [Toxocara canis]